MAADAVEGEQALAGLVEAITADRSGDESAGKVGDVDGSLCGVRDPDHGPCEFEEVRAAHREVAVDQYEVGHGVCAGQIRAGQDDDRSTGERLVADRKLASAGCARMAEHD